MKRRALAPAETALISEVTHDRRIDVVLGLALPIVCLIGDPIVFKDGGLLTPETSVFGRFRPFAYLLCAIGLASLGAFVVRPRASAMLAGAFLVCSAFAATTGTLLLPLSLIGMFYYGLGLLGLTPLLAAPVFFRACRRTMHASIASHGAPRAIRGLALGALLTLAISGVPQLLLTAYTDRLVTRVVHGDASDQDLAHLASLGVASNLVPIIVAYQRAKDENLRGYYARSYRTIIGRGLEEDLGWYSDD